MTIGGQQPLNKLTDLLRESVAQSGFTEVLTLSSSPSHPPPSLPFDASLVTNSSPPPHRSPQVATRMLAAGKTVNVGDHIPYVICTEEAAAAATTGGSPGQPAASSASIAGRAFHPDEVKKSNGALKVDVEWYLGQQVGWSPLRFVLAACLPRRLWRPWELDSPRALAPSLPFLLCSIDAALEAVVDCAQGSAPCCWWYVCVPRPPHPQPLCPLQILPPISRLCEPIQETSQARIAECLGLDPSRFRHTIKQSDGGCFAVGPVGATRTDACNVHTPKHACASCIHAHARVQSASTPRLAHTCTHLHTRPHTPVRPTRLPLFVDVHVADTHAAFVQTPHWRA